LKRKSKNSPSQTGEVKPRRKLDQKRKLDIIGILMAVFGVLLFLSLISHSTADETVADLGFGDFIKLFGGDPEIQARADITANWLGLLGALIAKFFINMTLGYFAISFPILLMLWGWFILRNKDVRALAYYTNYTLVLMFLAATFMGMLRLVTWLPEIPVVWAGNIGDFTSGILSRLIGTMGGVIVLITTITVLAVVVVDYDIHRTFERVQRIAIWLFRKVKGKASDVSMSIRNTAAEITELRDQKEKESITSSENQNLSQTPVLPNRTEDQELKTITPQLSPITSFSISRQDESEYHLSSQDAGVPFMLPTSESALPRSNGVISRDSIAGLSEYLGFESSDEMSKKSNAHAERPTRTDKTLKPMKQEESSDSNKPSDAEVFKSEDSLINEHEKKAVQQAVSQKIMNAADVDAEVNNAQMSQERLLYTTPPADLLDVQTHVKTVSDEELRLKADLVKEKLAVFGIEITSISVIPGPVVTQFELVPDSSVKISKIVALADDLALALAAKGIRIIAPIPGKSAVGIEIPNNTPEIVNFRNVVTSVQFRTTKSYLPLGLGKLITGDVYCDDLAKMPHLLIAGATGAGKSVGVNVMINSLLFKLHPSEAKLVMIDPKKIELAQYRGLRRHFLAVCPDIDEEIITDPANAVIVLKSLELEMDSRYTKLAKAGVRHVTDYNAKVRAGNVRDSETVKHYRLPYIVVIIDELADLMITAAREVEEPIARLAQLARAVGIHLIVATQRPSVDILTGVIKANFSARIAYQVASRIDSRTILDSSGADQLLGNGDMLFQPSGSPKPVRIQNAYLSTQEVERVVEFIGEQHGFVRPYLLPSVKKMKKGQTREDSIETDDLMYEAARLIVRHQQGSVSLLQRRLKIGYSRAARIVDQLEMAGIVGPYDGSKAREVMVEDEGQLEEMLHVM